MRYLVEYKWGHASYGKRDFNIPADATPQEVRRTAERTVPPGVTILEIKPNDLSIPLTEAS